MNIDKTTAFESAKGNAAKVGVDVGLGYLVGSKLGTNKLIQVAGGYGTGLTTNKLLPDAPDTGEVRTMIYRTNISTGANDIMIIVTNGYTSINYRYWQVYK